MKELLDKVIPDEHFISQPSEVLTAIKSSEEMQENLSELNKMLKKI
jgi:hypothetical protein